MSDESKWNERYRGVCDAVPAPARVLSENAHLLPPRGAALDLACGLGGNALYLAEQGLRVDAWDISSVAIEKVQATAERQGLIVDACARDVLAAPPKPDRFDVIVVSRYLERDLFPALITALRPGGLLFYQTFTRARIDDSGPSNDAYRLGDNELLRLCDGLRLRLYHEEGCTGDPAWGFRNEAMLVGEKPRILLLDRKW